MADTLPPTPEDFEAALAELLGSLEQERAMEGAGAAPRQVSSPVRTLGGQRMAGSRPMTPQEQTMLERPWVQMGRDAGALATSAIDTAGLGLPGVALDYAAPNALAAIRENERLANPGVTGAGTVLGAMGVQPRLALSALGGAYAAAAADDLGLIGPDAAQAQAPLTRRQQREMEMERQRAEREADIERRRLETEARLAREAKEGGLKAEVEAEAKRKDREAYDRQVAAADAAFNKEMGRQRRFSDTATGKVYDATGGLAPLAGGFLTGVIGRAYGGPDVSIPKTLGAGAVSGFGLANLPLIYNALGTEPDNPKRRAYEALEENLPADHPRRQDAIERLKDKTLLPEENPIRTQAAKELYDPWKMGERAVMGGLEGALGADWGIGKAGLTAKAFNALGRGLQDLVGRRQTAVARQPIPGVVVDDIPSASASSRAPTAARQIAGPTQPGSSGARGSQNQPQSPAPEASPNQPSNLPSWASEPPPGVKLPKDTFWDSNRNQPRRKDGTYVEMPKYRHPR